MVSLKKFSFLIFLSIFLISLLTIFLFPSPSEAAIGDNEMVSAQYGNGNAETKSLSDWAKAHCQGKPSSCTRAFIDGFNQKYDGTTNRDKYCDGIDNKSDNCEKPYDAGAQLATAVTRVHLSKINDKKKGEIIAKYCEAYKNQSSGSAKEKEEQAGICALGFSAGMSLANKEAACNNLVTKDYEPVCKQSYDAGRKLALGQDPGKAAPGAPDSSETEPDCDTTFTNPLSWILCPVMHGGAKFTDFVFGSLAKPLLQSNPIGLDSDNGFYKAWQSFRNIANIMLIGILLIMVFSQLTEGWGLNVVDAYTAKKMAPRILIGVIAINLSIYLCIAAIDITNIIGSGIEYLLTQPFADSEVLNNAKLETNTESVATAGIGAAVIGGGAFAAGKFGLIAAASTNIGAVVLEGAMMFLVPLFITLFFVGLGVIITLVVRFGLIVFLTVVSPIAIACFILPGTEKYFKSWWNLFLKTLFVYPIIAVIFAMSDIMAVIFVQNSNEISDAAGLVSVLVGIVAVYMPLFLIPFAFKFAGGAIGAIGKLSSDFASKRAGSLSEKYKKSTLDPNSTLGRFRNKQRGELIEKGMTGKQIGSGLLAGYRARGRGDSFKDAYKKKSQRIAEEHAASEEGLKKLMSTNAFQAIAGNDVATSGVLAATSPDMEGTSFNERRAAAQAAIRAEHFGNRADDDLNNVEKQQLLENTDAAMSLVGAADDKSVANAAILNMAKSKTGFKGGMGDALKHINAVNGKDSVATMNMIGRTREAFQAAGRLDGSGASFGSIVETNTAYLSELASIDKSLANGTITAQEAGERRKDAQGRANVKVARDSGIALTPYQIAQAAGDAQKNIAMAMAKDVDSAFTVMGEAEFDGTIDYAPRAGSDEAVDWKYKSAVGDPISKKEWGMKIVAEADGMYKALGSMGGKGKDIFGNVLMTTTVKRNGKEMSFNDVLDATALREDPTFRQFSYEYSSRYQREYSEANAENIRRNAEAEGQQ